MHHNEHTAVETPDTSPRRGSVAVGEEALMNATVLGMEWIHDAVDEANIERVPAHAAPSGPIENDTDRDFLREAVDIAEGRLDTVIRPAHLRALHMARVNPFAALTVAQLERSVHAARAVLALRDDWDADMKAVLCLWRDAAAAEKEARQNYEG